MDICDTLSQNLATTYTEGYRLIPIGVLALTHQHQNAVGVSMEMVRLVEKGVLGLSVASDKFPHFGIKQVVKED